MHMHQTMRQEKKSQTIVFADVSGSTRLFDQLGDVRARQIISRTLSILSNVVVAQSGRVVKNIGDEIMCVFPRLDDCMLAVTKMQSRINSDASLRSQNIQIKIGFHSGDVLEEDGDVFGDAVNVAARLVSQARAGQIMTSRSTIADMPSFFANARSLGLVKVKGKREAIEIFEVLWERDLSKITANVNPLRRVAGSGRLILHYQGEQYEVDEFNAPLTLGRDADNDLVIDNGLTSRKHASIDCRQGKFFLLDKSTNGLYLQIENRENFFIHRDELLLHGWGLISLGREITDNTTDCIQFRFLAG